MKVTLKNVRLAFPKLFEAKPVGQGKDQYFSAAFPIDPKSENHKALEAAIEAVAKEKWAAKAPGILATLREKGDIGYKHKPLKSGEGEVYDGFEGMFSVNASLNETKGRPLVVDRDPSIVLQAKDGRPYAGCYVNGVIDVWAQDNAYGKKINVQLKGIQFVKDGDAFGSGGAATSDDFDTIADGADAAEMC